MHNRIRNLNIDADEIQEVLLHESDISHEELVSAVIALCRDVDHLRDSLRRDREKIEILKNEFYARTPFKD